MVRSGCVSKRRRAGSPTMMLPSGSRLTTEGQSVEPFGPGIHFGVLVCESMYATRLFVVPRSIPTVRAICQDLAGADENLASKKPDPSRLRVNLSYRNPITAVPFGRWSPNSLHTSGDLVARLAGP